MNDKRVLLPAALSAVLLTGLPFTYAEARWYVTAGRKPVCHLTISVLTWRVNTTTALVP